MVDVLTGRLAMRRVTKLTPHQKFYLAGFRKGMNVAMGEARQLFHEQVHDLIKELAEVRAAYAELATRHHRAMHANAVAEAQQEREREPFKLLH
jgi:hypothetical protein